MPKALKLDASLGTPLNLLKVWGLLIFGVEWLVPAWATQRGATEVFFFYGGYTATGSAPAFKLLGMALVVQYGLYPSGAAFNMVCTLWLGQGLLCALGTRLMRTPSTACLGMALLFGPHVYLLPLYNGGSLAWVLMVSGFLAAKFPEEAPFWASLGLLFSLLAPPSQTSYWATFMTLVHLTALGMAQRLGPPSLEPNHRRVLGRGPCFLPINLLVRGLRRIGGCQSH